MTYSRNELRIETERFVLRPLQSSDASDTYLSWFATSGSEYISTAAQMQKRADLVQYIQERQKRQDILFLGIFIRETDIHIGNIKYEPINIPTQQATMGILLGDMQWRNKGVAREVIHASSLWLRDTCQIKQLNLGVASDNKAAIRAYERTGFIMTGSYLDEITGKTIIRMKLVLK